MSGRAGTKAKGIKNPTRNWPRIIMKRFSGNGIIFEGPTRIKANPDKKVAIIMTSLFSIRLVA